MNIESITDLSPPVLLLAVLNVFGFALKKSPVANWLIPWLLILGGGAVYPFIAEVGKVSFQVSSPQMFNVLIGLFIGGASVGAHQLFTQTRDRPEDK